jgi:NADPH:quinone reductase-like Zn-dependent oxidoreductase
MKATVQDKFGPPEVLELRDVPDPVVGENDVLVQVRAAGCGPDVWHIMAGKPYLVRMMPELRKMMRSVRGWDVAGQVEAVGANVTEFRSGDEEMGAVDGLTSLGTGCKGQVPSHSRTNRGVPSRQHRGRRSPPPCRSDPRNQSASCRR